VQHNLDKVETTVVSKNHFSNLIVQRMELKVMLRHLLKKRQLLKLRVKVMLSLLQLKKERLKLKLMRLMVEKTLLMPLKSQNNKPNCFTTL